jgi:hypothetical protein
MRAPLPGRARRRLTPTALVAAALLGGCSVDPITPPAARTTVRLGAAADSLYLSDSTVLVAHFPAAADSTPGDVIDLTWSSSDSAVAWPARRAATDSSAAAAVFARGAGRATISVRIRTRSGATGEASTTIVVRDVFRLGVWPDTNALLPGMTRTLAARELPGSQAAVPLTGASRWSSDAPTVAAVDSTGVVTAMSPGRATITAASGDRRATALVVVRTHGAPLRFTAITAGEQYNYVPAAHTCALSADGRAFCWGLNTRGALGSDGPMDRCEYTYFSPRTSPPQAGRFRCSAVPVEVDGGLRFTQLSAYASHTCGVTVGGDVWCWGDNYLGQAGTGEVTRRVFVGSSPGTLASPRRADAAVRFRQVSVGVAFTCALAEGGTAYCWGSNPGGRLATGATDSVVPRPAPVVGALAFSAITAGDTHACALTDEGAAWCWGDNVAGQLGDGRPVSPCAGPADTTCHAWSLRPRPVDTTLRFRELRAGHNATCGLALDGGLWCWGLIGVGVREQPWPFLSAGLVSRAPVRIDPSATFATLASAPYGDVQGFTGPCGIDAAGVQRCVRGSPPAAHPVAVTLPLAHAARPAAPYLDFDGGCGIGTDGITRCWYPSGLFGSRGDGLLQTPAAQRSVPTVVAGQ